MAWILVMALSACSHGVGGAEVTISKSKTGNNVYNIFMNGLSLGEVTLGRNGEFSVIGNQQKTWIAVFDGARENADSYPRVLIYKIIDGKMRPAEQHNFLKDLRVQDERSVSEMQFLNFDSEGFPVVYSTHGEQFTITE
jgi:hypothetical protein